MTALDILEREFPDIHRNDLQRIVWDCAAETPSYALASPTFMRALIIETERANGVYAQLAALYNQGYRGADLQLKPRDVR